MKRITIIISVLILASTLLMLSTRLSLVQAGPTEPGQGGYDYSAGVGWPGPDNLCICRHTSIWTDADCCIGEGVSGIYDYCDGNYGEYFYQLGEWSSDSGVGTEWNHLSDPMTYHDTPQFTLADSHEAIIYGVGGDPETGYLYVYNDDPPQWATDPAPYDIYNQLVNRIYYPGPTVDQYFPLSYCTEIGAGSAQWFCDSYSGYYFYMEDVQFIIAGPGPYSQYISVWS